MPCITLIINSVERKENTIVKRFGMFFEILKHIIWEILVKTFPIILYRPESRVIAGFCLNIAAASILYRKS